METEELLELDLGSGYYAKLFRSPTEAPRAAPQRPTKRHYALARLHLYPALPTLIQIRKFAPRCWKTNHGMYQDVKAIKEWLASFNLDANIHKTWLCNFCGMWHYECYPSDLTGQTSGKALRKSYWMILKGYAKTEYPDDPEKQKVEEEVNAIVRKVLG
jgi:hypothetical protein